MGIVAHCLYYFKRKDLTSKYFIVKTQKQTKLDS